MKNIFLTLVTLAVSTQALATSPIPGTVKLSNARLTFAWGPVAEFHHLPVGHSKSYLEVKPNGNVVYTAPGFARTKKVIAYLSAYQMDRIERLIDRAEKGRLVSPEVLCAAVPTETRSYHADRLKIILSVGAEPCGNEVYNASRAAQQLVEILNKLRSKAELEPMPLTE